MNADSAHTQLPQESPREILESILGHLGFTFEIQETEELEGHTLNIITREPGRLIGRNGHTLDELEYLLNRIIESQQDLHSRTGSSPASSETAKIRIDVEHYRKAERDQFITRWKEHADRVRSTGESIKLPPMNSYNRLLIHQYFKDDPDIKTRSEESSDRSGMKSIILEPRQK
jgi:spoIIIJ-associated protein